MNDATLTELKVVVERAVRPVRATMARKHRMREELLAHLVAIFDEEEKHSGDEQAALEQAKRRFGDPRELTGQLQQGVSRWDRCRSILENMGYHPSESAWHLATKHFVVLLLIYSAPFIVLTSGYLRSLAVEAQREFIPAVGLGLPLIALLNVFLSVVVASLLDKIGPALASKRRGRILLAVLCGLVVCGVALPPVAGAAVLFILMARQTVKEWRYQRAWA
ncbi:MAG: hypothetical protein HQ582_03035 [Planctomycetes bacterium]|nr:hypothetical protein [Planctomycetota bacterium]